MKNGKSRSDTVRGFKSPRKKKRHPKFGQRFLAITYTQPSVRIKDGCGHVGDDLSPRLSKGCNNFHTHLFPDQHTTGYKVTCARVYMAIRVLGRTGDYTYVLNTIFYLYRDFDVTL